MEKSDLMVVQECADFVAEGADFILVQDDVLWSSLLAIWPVILGQVITLHLIVSVARQLNHANTS